jgi:hypothetical protein
MLRSYTISPLDPKAKLFYNPAYNNGDVLTPSLEQACSAYKPLSARDLPAARPAAAMLPLTARAASEVRNGAWNA